LWPRHFLSLGGRYRLPVIPFPVATFDVISLKKCETGTSSAFANSKSQLELIRWSLGQFLNLLKR
jgi:hypothetical protein